MDPSVTAQQNPTGSELEFYVMNALVSAWQRALNELQEMEIGNSNSNSNNNNGVGIVAIDNDPIEKF